MHARATFDPDGNLDALIEGYVDGFPVFDPPTIEQTAPDPFAEVDPAIPGSAVPAKPAEPEGPSAEDSAWWALMTREHGPTGVGLDTGRAMCDASGLGSIGFNAGFLPHDGDWSTEADVPLPDWSSC